MRRRDQRDLVALLSKATTDAAAVEELLEREGIPDEIVGSPQQACEKILKAVLVARDVRYRHTHDLAELVDQVADPAGSFPQDLEAVVTFTPFAVTYRYEDLLIDDEPLDREAALALVRDLRRGAEGIIK